jgi:hypothetical protein
LTDGTYVNMAFEKLLTNDYLREQWMIILIFFADLIMVMDIEETQIFVCSFADIQH